MADVSLTVALIGDYHEGVAAHRAIPEALRLAGLQSGNAVEGVWFHTSRISEADSQFNDFAGIWCVPASPYQNTQGALDAIRYARLAGKPFLGTCGGFQHALIEYARGVLGWHDAEHAETAPDAALPIISPLECSLVEHSQDILLAEGGILRQAYGCSRIVETYHCRYAINPEFQDLLFEGSLVPTAYDRSGAVRGIELTGHPFFAATLFQPERRALGGEVPPLVAAFVIAMASQWTSAGRHASSAGAAIP